MKNSALKKLVEHPDKDEIIAKLVLDVSPQEIAGWLKEKYAAVGDSKLVIGVAILKAFKDDYLDLYQTIQNDAMALYNNSLNSNTASLVETDNNPVALINSNKEYKKMLAQYIEQEVDLKTLITEMTVACRARIEQLFVLIQQNPGNTKPDYVLIQWFQTLTALMEKQENIINGNPDKIIQQNNINIQILDQTVGVFQKVIQEIISRFDYETSLTFIDILNSEMQKVKPQSNEPKSFDTRFDEVKSLESTINSRMSNSDL